MKAHPSCEFVIYNGQVYYNNTPQLLGDSYRSPAANASGEPLKPADTPGEAWTGGQVRNVPPGFISLYEYNIDRAIDINNFIYPYIRKDSARASFRTAIASSSEGGWTKNEWESAVNSDILYGEYPLSASISRKYITTPSASLSASCPTCGPSPGVLVPEGQYDKQFVALKNRLNFYGNRSKHYLVTSSFGDKNIQILNMINVPSIFYGTQIQPGSISLKFYITGSLAGEVRDLKQNGELIQVSGTYQDDNFDDNGGDPLGRVAGVALYDEGIILLTGSWSLDGDIDTGGVSFIPAISCSNSSQPGCSDVSWYAADSPRWNNFGAGGNDLIQLNNFTLASDKEDFAKASFNMSFRGTTETQVMTMFAHAKRGETNFSNNPTSIQYGQEQLHFTSSHVYEENKERMLANIVSSSYSNYSGSFKRQVYVSRVAIYDEYKNLIGVATLANPVLKEEDQDYTFKLKLDI